MSRSLNVILQIQTSHIPQLEFQELNFSLPLWRPAAKMSCISVKALGVLQSGQPERYKTFTSTSTTFPELRVKLKRKHGRLKQRKTPERFVRSLIEETFLGRASKKLSFLCELFSNSHLFSQRSEPPKYFITAITQLGLKVTRITLEGQPVRGTGGVKRSDLSNAVSVRDFLNCSFLYPTVMRDVKRLGKAKGELDVSKQFHPYGFLFFILWEFYCHILQHDANLSYTYHANCYGFLFLHVSEQVRNVSTLHFSVCWSTSLPIGLNVLVSIL